MTSFSYGRMKSTERSLIYLNHCALQIKGLVPSGARIE